jgi:hypothetical protein
MLFILITNVLAAMFHKAEEWSLLYHLVVRGITHHASLHANDVIIFLSPVAIDLEMASNIFKIFECASGLTCNMNKCHIAPIKCEANHLELAALYFPCSMVEFPLRYLGIPLSIMSLPRAVWHHLIDDMADRLPGWKGNLMHKSDHLTLIKSTLAMVPVHAAISLELPAWARKAMIKIMHNFLWTGTDSVQGGKCVVAWNLVQRLLSLGGLGIPDLRVMGMPLQLCWLWLQQCDHSRPWSKLPVATDNIFKSFFQTLITCLVGNGEETLFWVNPWLDGHCIADWAPDLVAAVGVRCRNCRAIAKALVNNAWIRDIMGALSIRAIVQYFHLRAWLADVQLDPATSDRTL